MNFEEFAQQHGLILNNIKMDKWVPTGTVDKPKSSNGRYKYLGDVGWVQNWATMDKPVMWRGDKASASSADFRARIEQSKKIIEEENEKAAKKAGWILHQTEKMTHAYLASKGFPDEQGNVWVKGLERILVIPMRRNDRLVGVQLIGEDGKKKFLQGQASKGASFCMNAKGLPILCEGYATALSIRECMKANNIKYAIYVCFSASNMKLIAREIGGKLLVVADNDSNRVGELVAIEAQQPYWLSDTVGEDFNDYHKRVGTFKASQNLKTILLKHRLV